MRAQLDERFVREFQKDLENREEAATLLDLIDAEFRSDPTSVACFDLRLVERVRLCVEERKRLGRKIPTTRRGTP